MGTVAPLYFVAVGQLPPPITGFSNITNKFIEHIKAKYPVIVVDTTARGVRRYPTYYIVRLAWALFACWRLIRGSLSKKRVCYLACDGNAGLIFAILILSVARLCGYRSYLHHHSFSYIDRSSALMRALLGVSGQSVTHIFLCRIMQRRFQARYSNISKSHVLDNSPFVTLADDASTSVANYTGRPLSIGLLSNLCREKGLYLFLELLEAARLKGLDIQGILAGPAAFAEDRAAIEAFSIKYPGLLEYRGSVYDEAKAQFYRDIDIFVFPTLYANEAQPTVLFEAAAAGKLVIALDRGGISSQVGESDLLIFPDADFVTSAVSWLARWNASRMELAEVSIRRLESYRQFRKRSVNALDIFVESLGE